MREWCQVPERAELVYGRPDRWDVSRMTSLANLLNQNGLGCCNPPIGNWDTSRVTDMQGTFRGLGLDPLGGRCSNAFDADVNGWNTSRVTNLYATFYTAYSFGSSVDRWDIRKVTSFSSAFHQTGENLLALGGYPDCHKKLIYDSWRTQRGGISPPSNTVGTVDGASGFESWSTATCSLPPSPPASPRPPPSPPRSDVFRYSTLLNSQVGRTHTHRHQYVQYPFHFRP